MDQAYEALDLYKEALQMTLIIKDVQLMAEAKAKIGRIIFKILKDNAKARVFLYEAVTEILKEENEHLKQMEWGLNAQRDLKAIQTIRNDAHIEYGKQFEEALQKLHKEYEKNKPGNFLKYLKANHQSNAWKKNGYKLTRDQLTPEKIRRTVVQVQSFFHSDCEEVRDAGLNWLQI